jgi:hypothetical protein
VPGKTEGEAVMGRKEVSKPVPVATPGDAEALLNDWLETQSNLLGASLGQIASSQQAALSSWLELLNEVARQWQAPMAGALRLPWVARADGDKAYTDAWAALPAALGATVPGMVENYWASWSPFWERGTEQLA